LGFRAVAPDMRGYGGSTVHPQTADYAVEQIVADMVELLDSLGRDAAFWIGHDWGGPIVWSLAPHHAPRVHGVASLCVPYLPDGFAIDELLPFVDRAVYPADTHPVGQWDYHLYYEESFAQARATFEADPRAMVKAMFRKGDPAGRGKPSRLATVRRQGGWFGGAGRAPDLPRDPDVLDEEALDAYAAALARNGFFGPDSWYMNAAANTAYAKRAPNGPALAMPVLFFHALHDYVCETVDSRLAEPMRQNCSDLTEIVLPTGHWMAQERPELVNAGLARWLGRKFPDHWHPLARPLTPSR
ncbi:MAG TPA: alpha/beta fold hydrolase, partial [Ramlibacter sp.]|nr:alpha/beta fold hydrolase [Ramlibacter sp.]